MASPWPNTLFIPLSVGAASILSLFVHVLWQSTWGLDLRTVLFKTHSTTSTDCSLRSEYSIADHIQKHGGKTIFAFRTARLVGCVALLGLSSAALLLDDGQAQEIGMCGVYFYSAVLAIMSISANVKWSRIAIRHLNTVLLCTLAVYLYRDVFPLATNTLTPADIWEGQLLWPKIAILLAVSGIIPLIIPRQYIPLDSKNPMPVANPEQTASILSSVLYFWLDPIVSLAYRLPHLPVEQLPPLCDFDYADHLKARTFPHLDAFTSGRKRHVFFGFMWIFRREWFIMAVLLTVSALANFISPLALNRILNHLEDPSAESPMKPWFWVLLLFLGPFIYSLAFQWDMFVASHIMCQTNAIVTQLVFEHALRIRVKAETADKTDATSKPSSQTANVLGKINNLVTTDLNNVNEARNVLFIVVLVPIQIITAMVFLYKVLGWSAFVGMGTMIALFPLPGYAARLESRVQDKALEKTDARVQTFSETVNVVRMIKVFGWEKQMNEKIAEKREDELTWIWRRKVLYTASGILNFVVPTIVMIVTYVSLKIFLFYQVPFERSDPSLLVYTVIMKQRLTASSVFSSMAIFEILSGQLWFTFEGTSMVIKARVSLNRLNDFLNQTELLDSFTSNDAPATVIADEAPSEPIGFRDAIFSWANDDDADGTLTPSSRRFILRIEGELLFKSGFNLVVGPTGSGKTSLLMALLGEMHLIQSSPASWFNLPRQGGVSYAAQESWVLNDTIKNNILFNTPLDEQRYRKVIYQCCLERDLELFDAGDETEVGEKGLTLSGGQKARVTLARSVYANSQVVILDDILAALDVHTAKWVVEKCLGGDLLKSRTVILVTHNIAMTSKLADFVVSVGLDGRVHGEHSVSVALLADKVLAEEASHDQVALAVAEKELDAPKEGNQTTDKLILAEEIEIGRVSWDAMKMFLSAHASNSVLFFLGLFVAQLLVSIFVRLEPWYLGYWASQYEKDAPVSVFKYLGGFCLLILIEVVMYCTAHIYFTLGSFNASKSIHKQLVDSIMSATFRWLDITPTSRIITRCTEDTDAVDDALSDGLWELVDTSLGMLTAFVAVVIYSPAFVIPGILVGVIGVACGRIYLASQMSVKRELSNVKAPVLAHISATMAGLVSVRAYGAQDTLIQISINRINRLTRVSRMFANMNRWGTIRLDLLGALFTTSLAYYLVYLKSVSSSSKAVHLIYLNSNQRGYSLERIKQYVEIDHEPKPTGSGVPPAYWPASGSIGVRNLSAKYSVDGPKVLRDISFQVKSGDRVGIVGRTGSGKSSLTLALLRCIFTEGTVHYDGVPTSSLNLDALRANVTIIPQIPELLTGSLRANLDILGQYDDVVLNDALRAAGLTALQEEMEEGKLTLDTEISAGGNNLSVGQRQIIALARAIVRRSKLLILDEATSAIDYKTDAVIQTSLRTELPPDTTVFTVAHRLHSIMDADKIMVLDAGHIASNLRLNYSWLTSAQVEFDSPKVLLQNERGFLRALVDESGDKEVLYQMVERS
ncbi:P-loop containing nucleoside triphosphate hydrolase protein [Mycena metata]|uniref:P-loop containing nucleoside triphosphate hydrolase protein n=1 Tax=Mycena metata TaxID=1033252 RepID=A0AAD7NV06_9AGAR|nr:P-loop containing nucleoside triphosphate hydrolase protein [Mycena metata]